MVSFTRRSSPVGTSASKSKKPAVERAVNFPVEPVTSVSRPVTNEEHWALWRFEEHALNCAACHDPYKIHKTGAKLCDIGHKSAQDVARHIYRKKDGQLYSSVQDDYQDVRVEIPPGYDECVGLFKAIQRSVRHNKDFLSMDRSYHVRPRGVAEEPAASKDKRRSTVYAKVAPKVEHGDYSQPKRSSTMTDEPTIAEVHRQPSKGDDLKRGSLYHSDKAEFRERKEREQRLNYKLEVREPKHLKDIHRRSTYHA